MKSARSRNGEMNYTKFVSKIDERRTNLDLLYKRAVRELGPKSGVAREVPKLFDSMTGLMNVATKSLDLGKEKASYKDLGFDFRRREAPIMVDKDSDLSMIGKTLVAHIRDDLDSFFDNKGKISGPENKVFIANESKSFKGKTGDVHQKLDALEAAL